MQVKAGSVHGLIGPNGSGKSTFLNLVSGFYKVSSGEIRFDSSFISGASPNRIARYGIGRAFQHIEIFKEMSVLDNVKVGFHAMSSRGLLKILLALPAFKHQEQEIAERSMEILNFLGIGHMADMPAKHLSHGHQRLLGIGRALAGKPKLLLLDEPAAGLVRQEIDHLKDIIGSLRDRGMAVLLVEHHMELIMDICDTITVLNYGKKIAEGTPSAIQNNSDVIQAYLG